MVEGEWAGRVTGLGDQIVEIAMLANPDGHSRLKLSQFIRPAVVSDHRAAQVNALGYLRAMFTVEDIDEMVTRLKGKYVPSWLEKWFSIKILTEYAAFDRPMGCS